MMIQLIAAWCIVGVTGLVVLADEPAKMEKPKDRKFSKSVVVSGVEFDIAAESTWKHPAEVYELFEPDIVLRINNRTNKDCTFDLGNILRVSLKTAEGKELVKRPIPKFHLPEPIKVDAGKSITITLPIQIHHARTHDVCLAASSSYPGTSWLTENLPPGKYLLCLALESDREEKDAWLGKVRTEKLPIEIKLAN